MPRQRFNLENCLNVLLVEILLEALHITCSIWHDEVRHPPIYASSLVSCWVVIRLPRNPGVTPYSYLCVITNVPNYAFLEQFKTVLVGMPSGGSIT
jgi:hypothetical protein